MRTSKTELIVIVEYFEILDRKISKKKNGYYNIGIYFTGYQKKEHKQYIHMVIYETDGKTEKRLF